MRRIFTVLVLVTASAGCGGDSGGTSDPDAAGGPDGSTLPPGQRYEPWVAGAEWSYKLTDPTNVLPPALGKKTTVMAPRDVGGIHAGKSASFVHVEQMVGTKDVYETYVGDLAVRYKTEFYDDVGTLTATDVDQPYRLRIDESPAHTVTGAQWSETFTETTTKPGMAPSTSTKTDQWRVVDAAEQVTVMAGTYTALHLRRTNTGGVQDYWFVRGVGKVKETGGGQEEELMSYTPGM